MKTLIRSTFLLCLVLSFAPVLSAQETKREKNEPNFILPPDVVLLTIASQPDCPIIIERARILKALKGDSPGFYEYQVRNIGTKNITSYTLSAWTSEGNGSTLTRHKLDRELLPGESLRYPSIEPPLVPLTDDLKSQLGLRGPFKFVAILMVEYVQLSDGSTYRGESLSSTIADYFGQKEVPRVSPTQNNRRRVLPNQRKD